MCARNIEFMDDQQWPSACFAVDLPINPITTGLCVIDMQDYCVDAGGHLAHGLKLHDPQLFEAFSLRVESAICCTQQLLAAFRERGRKVIFTRHGSLLPDGGDLIERRRRREKIALVTSKEESGHLPAVGSPGHEIIPRLQPQVGELVLNKNTSSAFNSTALELFLRNMGLQTLVFAGLVSDQCVLMTALDAADRGFHCIIAEDACTTVDPGSHESSLLLFRRVWGYAMKTEEIIRWLSRQAQNRTAE